MQIPPNKRFIIDAHVDLHKNELLKGLLANVPIEPDAQTPPTSNEPPIM